MNVEEVKKVCEEYDFDFFGIRADYINYSVGDICHNSHQLFQDPDWNEEGELIYPLIEDRESPYYGYYDAGELDGTCAVAFSPNNEESIKKALENIKDYAGNYIYIIGGYDCEHGNDDGEIIIREAEVIGIE